MQNIDKTAHYYFLMHPLEGVMTPYGSIIYTSSTTREKWVECVIEDENEYRVSLRSIEPGYGMRKFYREDFESFLQRGQIVKKEPGMECVEEKWLEPLTDKAALMHSAYTLKIKKSRSKKWNA